jgi:DNA replication and repair protein RecF
VAEALRFGESGGYVRVELLVDDEARTVEVGLAAGRKTVRLDGQARPGGRGRPPRRRGEGGARGRRPDPRIRRPGRRGFLDDLLARLSLRYALMQREYHRVVEQRNAVLKRPGSPRRCRCGTPASSSSAPRSTACGGAC